MTIEEKLQHFYTASIDSAMQEAQQVQTQHQEALDKIFQEHKETKERQIQSHIQAETDNLKRRDQQNRLCQTAGIPPSSFR